MENLGMKKSMKKPKSSPHAKHEKHLHEVPKGKLKLPKSKDYK